MKPSLLILIAIACLLACKSKNGTGTSRTDILQQIIGGEEYEQMMNLSVDDFDQGPSGFRKHAGNYELISMLIPEYIEENQLTQQQATNLHWHLGQIHAFRGRYEQAISEMELARSDSSSISWICYVNGTIAFLKKDRTKLLEAYETLKQQDNQMNIEFLEKFMKYINKSYSEAYNAEI